MIERDVELKMVTAIATAIANALPVVGFWQPKQPGELKTVEANHVAVKALPRSNEGYRKSTIEIVAEISLTIDYADDPDGIKTALIGGQIMDLLSPLAADEDAAAVAFSTTNFRADAVTFREGGDCGYDDGADAFYLTLNVGIKGCTT